MIELFWSKDIKRDPKEAKRFLQGMCNRLMQGFCRYGPTEKSQKYMSRLILEAQKYKETGNAEYLFNIANYALLEYNAPENKKFHHDAFVGSATRGKIKI